ncbi:hypothetical protein BT69DRAFT_1283977, partial [Atractiella rhizophila]
MEKENISKTSSPLVARRSVNLSQDAVPLSLQKTQSTIAIPAPALLPPIAQAPLHVDTRSIQDMFQSADSPIDPTWKKVVERESRASESEAEEKDRKQKEEDDELRENKRAEGRKRQVEMMERRKRVEEQLVIPEFKRKSINSNNETPTAIQEALEGSDETPKKTRNSVSADNDDYYTEATSTPVRSTRTTSTVTTSLPRGGRSAFSTTSVGPTPANTPTKKNSHMRGETIWDLAAFFRCKSSDWDDVVEGTENCFSASSSAASGLCVGTN